MRRQERAVTDRSDLERILNRCRVCRVAVIAEDVPYVVPMNFGWEWQEETLCLYVHGAGEGRLRTALRKCPTVCVEMDIEGAVKTGEKACNWSIHYESIIGQGAATFVSNREEKQHGLILLMENLSGHRNWNFTSAQLDAVTVLKIRLTDVSGKHN